MYTTDILHPEKMSCDQPIVAYFLFYTIFATDLCGSYVILECYLEYSFFRGLYLRTFKNHPTLLCCICISIMYINKDTKIYIKTQAIQNTNKPTHADLSLLISDIFKILNFTHLFRRLKVYANEVQLPLYPIGHIFVF